MAGMTLSGLLSDSFGWESVFYVFGFFGAIWFVMWCIFVKIGYFGTGEEGAEIEALTLPSPANVTDPANRPVNNRGNLICYGVAFSICIIA